MLQGVFRGESPLTMRYDPPVIIVTPLGLLGNDTICHYKEGDAHKKERFLYHSVEKILRFPLVPIRKMLYNME